MAEAAMPSPSMADAAESVLDSRTITKAKCAACARRVPWFSFWGNFSLGVYKLAVGVFGGSTVLVADAMHSFADVLGSTSILVSTRISAINPDANYPYGRGKAEFLGAVFVYTMLLFFAGFIAYHAVQGMLSHNLEAPHGMTLFGALVSVLHNAFMYKYFTCVGLRNNSPAILADAFENRADAISSVAAIFGILGAMVIHPICDPIAAIVVAVIIVWNCQDQLRDAATGLMDRAMDDHDLERIENAVMSHEHVSKIAFLRTRQTGARYWMDIGIEVPAELTMQESDALMHSLRQTLARSPQCHYAQFFLLPPGSSPPRAPRHHDDDDDHDDGDDHDKAPPKRGGKAVAKKKARKGANARKGPDATSAAENAAANAAEPAKTEGAAAPRGADAPSAPTPRATGASASSPTPTSDDAAMTAADDEVSNGQ